MEIPKFKRKISPQVGLKFPWKLEAMSDGSVIVMDEDVEFALRFNQLGQELGRVYTADKANVSTLARNGEKFYLASEGGTVLTTRSGQTIAFDPPVPYLHDMTTSGDDFLLLTRDEVIRYGVDGRKVKTVIRGVAAIRIHVAKYTDCERIYLSDNEHKQIIVCSEDGSCVMTVGGPGTKDGQFKDVGGTATFDNGNILVADFLNCRVSEFSADGCFIRNLLTKKDNLQGPRSLSLFYPYLWVNEWDGSVKLFEFPATTRD